DRYDAVFPEEKIEEYKRALTDQTPVEDAVAALLGEHDGLIVSDTGPQPGTPGTPGVVADQMAVFKENGGETIYLDIFDLIDHQVFLDYLYQYGLILPELDAFIDELPERYPGFDPYALRRLLVAASDCRIRVVGVGGGFFEGAPLPGPTPLALAARMAELNRF